jgi:hypothetical protein
MHYISNTPLASDLILRVKFLIPSPKAASQPIWQYLALPPVGNIFAAVLKCNAVELLDLVSAGGYLPWIMDLKHRLGITDN